MNRGLRAGRLQLARFFILFVVLLCAALTAWHLLERYRTWHLWEGFKQSYISDDGRVIDHLLDSRSTSEGQAYAMFFALVANDRGAFEGIRDWTENNLAQGDLSGVLPAWLWAKDSATDSKAKGKWKILDPNSATDADLWMAYSLLEAGRIWRVPEYTKQGRALARQVFRKTHVELPGIGSMLLPAPTGFEIADGLWRFNPSYLPPFILKRLASEMPDLQWVEVGRSAETLLIQSVRNGLVPDWYACCEQGKVIDDPVGGAIGGYEAIRVYLWQAISTASNLRQGALFAKIQGMAKIIQDTGRVPERIRIVDRLVEGRAPVGFVAALLPYLGISGNDMLLSRLEKQVKANWRSHTVGDRANYYDAALGLFALGWLHGQYSFDPNGRLLTRWSGYGV